MAVIIAMILFMVFLFLSSLHFYWALGGRWKKDAAIPTKANNVKVFRPGVLATAVVGSGLMLFGLIVLIVIIRPQIEFLGWSHVIADYMLWIIAGIFILRAIGEFKYIGVFKKYRNTPFGRNDTKYYSPLCLVIGILSIMLALCKKGTSYF